MKFQFNPAQVEQLQTAYTAALASTASKGRYADAYRLISDMISVKNTEGEITGPVPEVGDDKASWVFLHGVPFVNEGVGAYSEFIREYTKKQYKLRFGENHLRTR